MRVNGREWRAPAEREGMGFLRYPELRMLRRWWIAFALSIAAHVAVVGGIVAWLFVNGLTFSGRIDVEISGMRLDEVHDLPLGPPPSAGEHPAIDVKPMQTRIRSQLDDALKRKLARCRASPCPDSRPSSQSPTGHNERSGSPRMLGMQADRFCNSDQSSRLRLPDSSQQRCVRFSPAASAN